MLGITIRIKTVIIALCVLAIAGCTTTYRNHGYAPNDEDLSLIEVGVSSRDAVIEAVGAPSTAGLLSEGDFYYVRSRVKSFAYQRNQVIERQVLAISFDERGLVQNIERFGLQDGKVVPLSRRVTSSSVENKGFLRQLLGNLGKFNAGDFLN